MSSPTYVASQSLVASLSGTFDKPPSVTGALAWWTSQQNYSHSTDTTACSGSIHFFLRSYRLLSSANFENSPPLLSLCHQGMFHHIDSDYLPLAMIDQLLARHDLWMYVACLRGCKKCRSCTYHFSRLLGALDAKHSAGSVRVGYYPSVEN